MKNTPLRTELRVLGDAHLVSGHTISLNRKMFKAPRAGLIKMYRRIKRRWRLSRVGQSRENTPGTFGLRTAEMEGMFQASFHFFLKRSLCLWLSCAYRSNTAWSFYLVGKGVPVKGGQIEMVALEIERE